MKSAHRREWTPTPWQSREGRLRTDSDAVEAQYQILERICLWSLRSEKSLRCNELKHRIDGWGFMATGFDRYFGGVDRALHALPLKRKQALTARRNMLYGIHVTAPCSLPVRFWGWMRYKALGAFLAGANGRPRRWARRLSQVRLAHERTTIY